MAARIPLIALLALMLSLGGCSLGDDDSDQPEKRSLKGKNTNAKASAAQTFGTNLNRSVDSTVGCAVHPSYPYPFYSGSSSCTWLTSGSFATISESLQVPSGRGSISRVRVKEGAYPGPMKITLLRTTGFPGMAQGCCVAVGESAVFTPGANKITEVPVNFGDVRNWTNPATGTPEVDTLAITVMNTSTSVPLHNTGQFDGSVLGQTWYPGVANGQERFTGIYTNYGFMAMLNADWAPLGSGSSPTSGYPPLPVFSPPAKSGTGTGTGTGKGSAPPPPSTGQTFSVGRASAAPGGAAKLDVEVSAAGTVSAGDATAKASATASKSSKGPDPAAAAKKGASTLLKPVSTRVKKGGTVSLTLKPTAAAKAKLKKRRSVSVKVAVVYTPNGGKPQTRTTKVVLKR